MAKPKRYDNLRIDDIDFKGHGVANSNGYVLFVDGALPGDCIDATVRRKKKAHALCRIEHIHSTEIERIEPFCEHFFDCGGCVWQDIPYEKQLALKQRMVEQAMHRHRINGTESDADELPILGCESRRHYRNRLDYSFSAHRWVTRSEAETDARVKKTGALGFHAPRRFDKIIEIERCHLQPEPTNEIRNALRVFTMEQGYEYYDPISYSGYLRNVVVRTSLLGEVLVLIVYAYDDPKRSSELAAFLSERVGSITSIYDMINDTKNDDIGRHEARHVYGEPIIHERCGHIILKIHPKSFYQTNPGQAEKLYSIVRAWASLTGSEHVLDLYCGIGGIGLFLSEDCASVSGLELVPEAVEQARENAAANSIANADFTVGSAETILPEWVKDGRIPDLVVVDPPRAGLHPAVVESLLDLKSPRIIYISCNPGTQAKDIGVLASKYTLTRYQPVDMFPQTRHVENIAELVLR